MEEKQKRKPRSEFLDRIVLDKDSQQALKVLAEQIKLETNDLFNVPTKDLANYLIQSRSHPLTKSDVQYLRSKHFNTIKALKWAMDTVREALARGEQMDVSDVLKKLEMHGVEQNARAKMASINRKSKKSKPDSNESNESTTDAIINSETPPSE